MGWCEPIDLTTQTIKNEPSKHNFVLNETEIEPSYSNEKPKKIKIKLCYKNTNYY